MKVSRQIQNAYSRSGAIKPFEEFLQDIYNIIKQNTPKKMHGRIKQKFMDLKIIEQTNNKSSEFDTENFVLKINVAHANDPNVYLHEIMHYIGTEKQTNQIFIGLNNRRYINIEKNIISCNFGYGANEGLNQHYTEKFIKGYHAISEVSPEYSFCANIMSSLEKLVGEDKCKMAHFCGSGIKALIPAIVESCHLPNENKAIKILLQLDAYKTIARNYICFGVTYSPDIRVILVDAYKTLLTIALMKAKAENKDILYSEIISFDHLNGNNQKYFVDYIQKDLIKFFYQEKQHIFEETPSNFKGIDYETLSKTTNLVFEDYITTNNIDSNHIPEQLKCGEFYNHILLSCMINDQNLNSRLIFTSDFQAKLTQALFDHQNKLVPEYKKEMVQLVKQVLASRNVVRCGAEICDDYIIMACDDKDFNVYLMDTAPEVYKSLFSYIPNHIKQDPNLVEKMLCEVFRSKVDLYKFGKEMQDIIKSNTEIQNLYENAINQTHKTNNDTKKF